MDLNVKVLLEMSDRTNEAVTRLLNLLEAGQKLAPTKNEASEQQQVNNNLPLAKTIELDKPDEKGCAKKEVIVSESAAEAPDMTAVPEETADTEVPPFLNNLSTADLRAAMDKTTKRLEDMVSDDLKERVHKQALKEYRNLAKQLGYEKPSALPEGELRGKFVQLLDNFTTDSEGVVTPF